MEFVKSFNNNVALVLDDEQKEWIVIGKGIGFGMKLGSQIDETKVERRFLAADQMNQVISRLQEFKTQSLELTGAITKMVEKELKFEFSPKDYLSLADHIDFALTRAQEGIELSSQSIKWETKKLYPHEFALAKKALAEIEQTAGISLPDSEIFLMTYHFVNAQAKESKLQETIQITNLIADTMKIVNLDYPQLDRESFNYGRFVGHLRAMFIRKLKDQANDETPLDKALLEVMIGKYPKEYATVKKLSEFLKTKKAIAITPDDEVYLLLHIVRVTNRQEAE